MSVDTITVHDLVVQSQGFLVSDMNGEKIMLSIENGKYYNLGELGGRVWELIASPISVPDMVQQLITEYEIERGACEQQVRAFLQKLAAEGLIQIRRA